MSCFLFSLRFTAPVHFGLSDAAMSLYASEETFRADTLFSALCHTALHAEGEAGVTRLCEAVPAREIDAFRRHALLRRYILSSKALYPCALIRGASGKAAKDHEKAALAPDACL